MGLDSDQRTGILQDRKDGIAVIVIFKMKKAGENKMQKKKKITIRDTEIEVNEITALQSQEYLKNLSNDKDSFIDELFPERVPASLTRLCTGLTDEKLLSFYPSEIEEIIDAVEEVNPTIASKIKKLAEIGREVIKNPELMKKLNLGSSKKTAQD